MVTMPHGNLTPQFYSYTVPRSLIRKQSKLPVQPPGAPEVWGKSTKTGLLPRQSRKSLLSPLCTFLSHGIYLFLPSSSSKFHTQTICYIKSTLQQNHRPRGNLFHTSAGTQPATSLGHRSSRQCPNPVQHPGIVQQLPCSALPSCITATSNTSICPLTCKKPLRKISTIKTSARP